MNLNFSKIDYSLNENKGMFIAKFCEVYPKNWGLNVRSILRIDKHLIKLLVWILSLSFLEIREFQIMFKIRFKNKFSHFHFVHSCCNSNVEKLECK